MNLWGCLENLLNMEGIFSKTTQLPTKSLVEFKDNSRVQWAIVVQIEHWACYSVYSGGLTPLEGYEPCEIKVYFQGGAMK